MLLVHSEPITLRLDVRGAKDVTAADIQPHADVEILNPELHIATLNTKGRLALDITVDHGRGYVSADRRQASRHHRRHPGRLDLLAGPAGHVHRRAHSGRAVHRLRPARARRRTDGSISRRESLASAGATLRSLVQLVAEMSGDARRVCELGELGLAAAVRPISICRSRISTCPSARNCLKRAQVNSIGELLRQDRGRPPRHRQLRPEVARRGGIRGQARRAAVCRSTPTNPATDRGGSRVDARETPQGSPASAGDAGPPDGDDGQPGGARCSRRRPSSRPRPRPRRCARWPKSSSPRPRRRASTPMSACTSCARCSRSWATAR